jgi:hypothetical protein
LAQKNSKGLTQVLTFVQQLSLLLINFAEFCQKNISQIWQELRRILDSFF